MFFYSLIWVSLKKKGIYSLVRVNTLHKKLSFPLGICSVYVTKSAGNWGFGQIYWRKSQWKTSFFVQWQRFSIRKQITKHKRNSAAMFLSSQVTPGSQEGIITDHAWKMGIVSYKRFAVVAVLHFWNIWFYTFSIFFVYDIL